MQPLAPTPPHAPHASHAPHALYPDRVISVAALALIPVTIWIAIARSIPAPTAGGVIMLLLAVAGLSALRGRVDRHH